MATPQKIGKYEIQDVLGKGGMGSVYRGFDPAISRAVAIKAISKTSLGEDDLKHIMQRFRHEAQAVGWTVALIFAIAMGLRLARFNVMIEDPDRPDWKKDFFVGMPAPAGALWA